MPLFKKKTPQISYDPETQEPAVRRSICTGETTAGFKELHAPGKYREVMLIRSPHDLEEFMKTYGIEETPKTEY